MPASLGCLALDQHLTGGTARRGMDPSGEGQHRLRGGPTASVVPPPGTTPLHRPPGGLLAACQAPQSMQQALQGCPEPRLAVQASSGGISAKVIPALKTLQQQYP